MRWKTCACHPTIFAPRSWSRFSRRLDANDNEIKIASFSAIGLPDRVNLRASTSGTCQTVFSRHAWIPRPCLAVVLQTCTLNNSYSRSLDAPLLSQCSWLQIVWVRRQSRLAIDLAWLVLACYDCCAAHSSHGVLLSPFPLLLHPCLVTTTLFRRGNRPVLQ